jgi:hypothetical protein
MMYNLGSLCFIVFYDLVDYLEDSLNNHFFYVELVLEVMVPLVVFLLVDESNCFFGLG